MPNEIWKAIPSNLDLFIGQKNVVKSLQITLESAKKRKTLPDHIMLCGPPGLGKSTLATLVARELKVPIEKLTGTKLSYKKEVYGLVDRIRSSPLLLVFIDEIHRLPKRWAEVLYSIMQDNEVDGEIIRGIYTVMGATTTTGMLDKPLRDRFKHTYLVSHYSNQEIKEIILSICPGINNDVAESIANRAHGIPREAKNLLTETINTAIVRDRTLPTKVDLDDTLNRLGIDSIGLKEIDRNILLYMRSREKPIGENELRQVIFLSKDDFSMHESTLLKHKLIIRTPRGRKLTVVGERHIDRWTH